MIKKILLRKINTSKKLIKENGFFFFIKHIIKKYIFRPIDNKFAFSALLDKPSISQNIKEFSGFLKKMKEKKVKKVLEIGTYKGGSAYYFKKFLNAEVETIDIKSYFFTKIMLKKNGVNFIEGNSHSKEVFEKVKGKEYDLLFIDGDHAYSSVKKDFEMYSPLARIVAFHDIYSWEGVKKFWNEIKNNYKNEEIVDLNNPLGIGILYFKKYKKEI